MCGCSASIAHTTKKAASSVTSATLHSRMPSAFLTLCYSQVLCLYIQSTYQTPTCERFLCRPSMFFVYKDVLLCHTHLHEAFFPYVTSNDSGISLVQPTPTPSPPELPVRQMKVDVSASAYAEQSGGYWHEQEASASSERSTERQRPLEGQIQRYRLLGNLVPAICDFGLQKLWEQILLVTLQRLRQIQPSEQELQPLQTPAAKLQRQEHITTFTIEVFTCLFILFISCSFLDSEYVLTSISCRFLSFATYE